jgi:hypothetical protein
MPKTLQFQLGNNGSISAVRMNEFHRNVLYNSSTAYEGTGVRVSAPLATPDYDPAMKTATSSKFVVPVFNNEQSSYLPVLM